MSPNQNWWQVIPFPLCELQSKWIASLLSDRITLPSEEDMTEDVNTFYSSLQSLGTPKRYTHQMAGSLQVKGAQTDSIPFSMRTLCSLLSFHNVLKAKFAV